MLVYGTQAERYKKWHARQGITRNNGAYYYSKEIEKNILPSIKANNLIVTAGASLYEVREIPNGSIMVCHDNRTTSKSYRKFFGKNILWVCSKQSTVDNLHRLGEKAVYIPLSIDIEYVKRFKRDKTGDTAFVGNAWAFKESYLKSLPKGIAQLSNMNRDEILDAMAKYKYVIAEGRCLMEAQVLGAIGEVPKYENLEAVFVEPLDNKDTIPDWQKAANSHKVPPCIIRVVRQFNDIDAKTSRRPGDVFYATKKRGKELASNKYKIAEIV